VSELVIEVERVNRSHEAAVTGARYRDGFLTHSTGKIPRRRKCKKTLYLCAVSCEQCRAQTVEISQHISTGLPVQGV